jgi:DNA repair photolyase
LSAPERAFPPASRPSLRIEVLERTGIPFYVQFTLTPYGVELEPRVPPVDRAVETFLRLSGRIGPDRVVWRYDPILLGGGWEIRDHLRSFEALALRLAGATRRCTLSFLDFYPRIRRRLERMGLREIAPEERALLAEGILRIARPLGIRADLCAEPPGPGLEGIPRARCVDPVLLGFSTDEGASFRRDRNQRPCCGCAPSADIGAYGTCGHGCRYCYAGSGDGRPDRGLRSDPLSPLPNG